MDARAQQIFESALEVPEAQRATFVKGACGEDAALRLEVESLLDVHRAAGEFLGEPTISTVDIAKTRVGGLEQTGAQIGPFKLLELIGEGGFGSVYLAEQRSPVVRRVALKIIKLGMDTRQVVARFEQERQALAMMDHPNIAKVLEAGATESGRPYFVMELVRGVPITDYCKSGNLTTRDRLELLIPVCQAVQHAHQKGIIHRDIKPSNILVSLEGNQAVPKIIDFGIAKATNARLTELTLITEQRSIVGTPTYMSPEQANLSGLDVDTRTDIYSLGVLLYELLTGTTPFDSKELLQAGYAEIQRIIREVDPPKPSTRMESAETAAAAAATAAATASGKRAPSGTRRLSRVIRGELDWIVMKAMEKDRRRRYETASALADDIQRYLAGETIAAAPPSASYRAKKFFARNRVSVAFTSLLLAAILIGLATTSWQYLRASHQRAEAQREAARAREVVDFVVDSLKSQDPLSRGKQGMTIAGTMKQTVAKLNRGDLADQPATQAILFRTIASILRNNAELETAKDLAERSLTIERGLHPGDDLDLALSLRVTGSVYQFMGDNDEAEARYTEALAMLRRILPTNHLYIAQTLSSLGSVHYATGDHQAAKDLHSEALAMKKLLFQGDSEEVAISLEGFGNALEGLRDVEGATQVRTQAIDMFQRLSIGDSPNLATTMHNTARGLKHLGDLKAAERMSTAALEMRQRIFPEGAVHVFVTLCQLADIQELLGRLTEAQKLYQQAADMAARLPHGESMRQGAQEELDKITVKLEAQRRGEPPEPATGPDK